MLDLPWVVAPRDLAAGEHIALGREIDADTRPPVSRDVVLELAEAAPKGAILALGSDGRLHRLTAATAAPDDKPGRKTTTRVPAATARRAASVSRPARRTRNG